MSLHTVKTTDPVSDPLTVALFATAIDSWADQLADASTEFSIMGLKLFENVNGFFPGQDPHSEKSKIFLKDLNEFVLAWPSKEELDEADKIDAAKAMLESSPTKGVARD